MNKQLKYVFNAVNAAILGVTAGAVFSSQKLVAQEDDAVQEEEIIITGSRLRRIDTESASPVVSISAADIQSSGFSSVQDVLGDSTLNTGGSLDQQQVFGFTPSASGVNLRGAGLGRSLTLINGKRLPKYPIPAGGTENFVDTANIPLGAVERVEILTSGASAIYGSDAMGGVINVILKDSFDGLEIKAKVGDTDHGGRQESNISLVAGTTAERSRLMFFLEYDKKATLKATDRNNFNNLGSDLAYGSTFGAYSSYGVSLRNLSNQVVATLPEAECIARGLQPTTTGGVYNCGFNRAQRRDLFPEMERTSALINFSLDLNETTELYTRFDYSFSNSFRSIEPMPVAEYTYFLGTDEDENPDPGFVTLSSDLSGSTARFAQETAFGGDFADLEDGIYYPTRRMIEFGDRRTRSETDNYTLLNGVKGELGSSWHWDLDWQFSRTRFYDVNPGYASADLYFNFLASGESGRSIFDLMTPDEVTSASYLPWSDAESTFTGFSGSFDGDLFELPAGPLALAVGFESYREWFFNTSDTESTKGNILSTGGSSGKGERDYSAIFAESLVPITESLNTTLALRYDDYSDFGDNLSPQIGLEYRPIDNLLLRALWADTFRAPDMQRVYGDPTQAFNQIIDPFGCEQQGGSIDPDSIIAACNGELYVDVLLGPNSELGPEVGTNWNLGVVYNSGEFDASVDLWKMEIEDIVNELSAQDIASDFELYESLITRNAVGEIEAVNATAQNLSFRETSGVDLALGYTLPTDNIGQFRFRLNTTYLLDYDEQFSLTTPTESQIEVDRIPELRAQFSVGWDINSFSTNMYISYIGEMNGTNNEDLEGSDIPLKIEDQFKINLSSSYGMEHYSIQIGINNLTDEGPVLDPTDNGWPYYPQEYYNALGRSYYVSASYKFD